LLISAEEPLAIPLGSCLRFRSLGLELLIFANDEKAQDDLKLTFVAERPPPPRLAFQEYLMAAEASTEYAS